jgi:hypothetical protein
VRVKNIPAYAHSFKRGYLGERIAAEPRSFQTPRIVAKYAG